MVEVLCNLSKIMHFILVLNNSRYMNIAYDLEFPLDFSRIEDALDETTIISSKIYDIIISLM